MSPFGKVIGSVSAQRFDPSSGTPFLEEHVDDTDGKYLHESTPYGDPALHDSAVVDTHDNPGGRPALNVFIESDWPDGGGNVMVEHGRDSRSHGPGDDLMKDGLDGVQSDGEVEREGMHAELGMASGGAQLQGDVKVEQGESVNGRNIGDDVATSDGKNLAGEADDIVDGETDDDEGEGEDLDEDEEEEEYEEDYDEEGIEDGELLDETIDIPGGEAAAEVGKTGGNEEHKNVNVTDDVNTESLDGEAKDKISDNVQENNDVVKDDAEIVNTEKTNGDNACMPGYVKESAAEHNSEPATATVVDSTTVGPDEVTTIHGLDSTRTIVVEGTTIVGDYIEQPSKVVVLESSQIILPTRSTEATPTPAPVKSSASVDNAATLSPPVEPTPASVPPSTSTAVAREEPTKIEDPEATKAVTADVADPEDDDELIDIQTEFKEVAGFAVKPPSIPGGKKSDAYVTPGFQTRRPLGNPDDSTPHIVKETHETTYEKNAETPGDVTPVPMDIEVAPPVGEFGVTTEPNIQVAEEHDVDSTMQEGGSGWIVVSFAANVLSLLEPILQALVNVVSNLIGQSLTTREGHVFESSTHTIPSL